MVSHKLSGHNFTFSEYIYGCCKRSVQVNSTSPPKSLIVLNSHGGNSAALTTCLTDLYAENRIRVILAQWWTMIGSNIKELGIKTPLLHAEEIETSVMMALGANVRVDQLSRAGFDRQEIHQSKGIPTSKHIAYDYITPGSGVIIPPDYIDDFIRYWRPGRFFFSHQRKRAEASRRSHSSASRFGPRPMQEMKVRIVYLPVPSLPQTAKFGRQGEERGRMKERCVLK